MISDVKQESGKTVPSIYMRGTENMLVPAETSQENSSPYEQVCIDGQISSDEELVFPLPSKLF